jgi:hypothetical protein
MSALPCVRGQFCAGINRQTTSRTQDNTGAPGFSPTPILIDVPSIKPVVTHSWTYQSSGLL